MRQLIAVEKFISRGFSDENSNYIDFICRTKKNNINNKDFCVIPLPGMRRLKIVSGHKYELYFLSSNLLRSLRKN